MKIAVITDSGSNLSFDYVSKHKNLFLIPLLINVDGKSYRDQVEISSTEIYSKIDEKTIKTSLPYMSDLENTINKIKEEQYTDLLVLNISSGLSGTYNAFRLKFQEVEGINITQYDTKTLASGQGYLVEKAVELISQNKSVNEIIEVLDIERYENSLAMYTINTLKYLKKGGRIGKIEGTIGDVLNIKPIITVDNNGVYITLAKPFGFKRALIHMGKLLVKKFASLKIDLTVHYGNDIEKAKELGNRLVKLLNVRNLVISELTPVLGIHTGPDMFAFIGKLV